MIFNTRARLSPLEVVGRLDPASFHRAQHIMEAPLTESIRVPSFQRDGGIATRVLELLEAKLGPKSMRYANITVRRRVKYMTWHTDFAAHKGVVSNYLLVTGAPATRFLDAPMVEALNVGVNAHDQAKGPLHAVIERRVEAGELSSFELEPWTIIGYDAFELHRGHRPSRDDGSRLFVRVTISDPR